MIPVSAVDEVNDLFLSLVECELTRLAEKNRVTHSCIVKYLRLIHLHYIKGAGCEHILKGNFIIHVS